MIKSGQIEDLAKAGFHYITAITKPQIDTLMAAGVMQMELFADQVCEVEQEGVRYVLRRNPLRAQQLAASRSSKQARVEELQKNGNDYLAQHPRAKLSTAEGKLRKKIAQLKIDQWLLVEEQGRTLQLKRECHRLRRSLPAGRLLRDQDGPSRPRSRPRRWCMTATRI